MLSEFEKLSSALSQNNYKEVELVLGYSDNRKKLVEQLLAQYGKSDLINIVLKIKSQHLQNQVLSFCESWKELKNESNINDNETIIFKYTEKENIYKNMMNRTYIKG